MSDPDDPMFTTPTRVEISRFLPYSPADIFTVLRDPAGHVAIDSTGMLQGFTGAPVEQVGDSFTIHMDRESLGDFDLGRYDVTVIITDYAADERIAWTIDGQLKPPIGHIYGYSLTSASGTGHNEGRDGTLVTSFYDWTDIHDDWRAADIFPVISPLAVKATLGILERTVAERHTANEE